LCGSGIVLIVHVSRPRRNPNPGVGVVLWKVYRLEEEQVISRYEKKVLRRGIDNLEWVTLVVSISVQLVGTVGTPLPL
jgi:hypothetical protein